MFCWPRRRCFVSTKRGSRKFRCRRFVCLKRWSQKFRRRRGGPRNSNAGTPWPTSCGQPDLANQPSTANPRQPTLDGKFWASSLGQSILSKQPWPATVAKKAWSESPGQTALARKRSPPNTGRDQIGPKWIAQKESKLIQMGLVKKSRARGQRTRKDVVDEWLRRSFLTLRLPQQNEYLTMV